MWLQMVNDLNTPSIPKEEQTLGKPENQLHSEKVWGSRYFIVVNSIKKLIAAKHRHYLESRNNSMCFAMNNDKKFTLKIGHTSQN